MAMGDNGTGDKGQYEVALRWSLAHEVPLRIIHHARDNLYGSSSGGLRHEVRAPLQRCSMPREVLRVARNTTTRRTAFTNRGHGGERYFDYSKKNVKSSSSIRLHGSETARLAGDHAENTRETGKIATSHPLYSSATHGSEVDLRVLIEPLFIKYASTSSIRARPHLHG